MACTLTAATTIAADVRLGAEIALTPAGDVRGQTTVQIASSGNRIVSVWRDAAGMEIDGAIDGVPFSVRRSGIALTRGPWVVAGEHSILVLWTEGLSSPFTLIVQRVGFDGVLLDPVPVILARPIGSPFNEPGLAYDDGAFVVTWPEETSRVARVSDGGALTVAERALSDWRDTARPLHAGNELLIASVRYRIVASPTVYAMTYFWLTPIDGVPTDEELFLGRDAAWEVAAGADRVTFIGVCECSSVPLPVIVTQVSLDGTRVLSRHTDARLSNVNVAAMALAWNGAEYVLAWTDWLGVIRAMRLRADGQVIDAEPFAVSPPGTRADQPSLLVTPDGVAIAYSRYEGPDGPRAFMRTLYRTATPSRKRTVRR